VAVEGFAVLQLHQHGVALGGRKQAERKLYNIVSEYIQRGF
jgi:hypothetical protein